MNEGFVRHFVVQHKHSSEEPEDTHKTHRTTAIGTLINYSTLLEHFPILFTLN